MNVIVFNSNLYYSAGPKNYCVVFYDANGNVKWVIHVRGLSLHSDHVKAYINLERMRTFAEALINGQREAVVVPQFKLTVFNGERQVETLMYTKHFQCPLVSKRVILPNSLHCLVQSMPYGYTRELCENVRAQFFPVI
jgi:hypothetical protein